MSTTTRRRHAYAEPAPTDGLDGGVRPQRSPLSRPCMEHRGSRRPRVCASGAGGRVSCRPRSINRAHAQPGRPQNPNSPRRRGAHLCLVRRGLRAGASGGPRRRAALDERCAVHADVRPDERGAQAATHRPSARLRFVQGLVRESLRSRADAHDPASALEAFAAPAAQRRAARLEMRDMLRRVYS